MCEAITFNHMVKYSGQLDRTFAALADPTRRNILARLSQGASSVTELAEPFEMSLPAVSKHLRVLERAGLCSRTKDGRVHRIQLRAEPMREAAGWVEQYRIFWEGNLDALGQFLDRTARNEQEERS